MFGIGGNSIWNGLAGVDAVELPVDELAGVLLRVIVKPDLPNGGMVSPGGLAQEVDEWPNVSHGRPAAKGAIFEAFHWLLINGLVMHEPQPNATYFRVTRAGRALAETGSLDQFKAAALVPKALLHSSLRSDAWANFLRGDYDVAIFIAFRNVEDLVRKHSGLATQYGTNLMRKAFGNGGPLARLDGPDAEREAEAGLYSGAIGAFKNPQSHKIVGTSQAAEAARLMFFASYLLDLTDARAFDRATTTTG